MDDCKTQTFVNTGDGQSCKGCFELCTSKVGDIFTYDPEYGGGEYTRLPDGAICHFVINGVPSTFHDLPICLQREFRDILRAANES